jgi:hypothetical protein
MLRIMLEKIAQRTRTFKLVAFRGIDPEKEIGQSGLSFAACARRLLIELHTSADRTVAVVAGYRTAGAAAPVLAPKLLASSSSITAP